MTSFGVTGHGKCLAHSVYYSCRLRILQVLVRKSDMQVQRWHWNPNISIYTMNTGSKDEAATNNNMYTHCNSTTSTTTTSITGTTSPTSSSPSSQNTGATPAPSQAATTTSVGSTSNSKIPTIVGAVIGSVVVVGVVVLARFCWRKRQRRRSTRLSSDADNLHASQTAIISPYTVSGESLLPCPPR